MGRRITHIWGDAGADTLHEQPGCLTARPVKPAALLTVFAEHLKSPLAMALRLLPAATCPSFSSGGWKPAPLDGASCATETWPAKTLGRICIVSPSTVSPPTSHDLSGHQQLALLGADFEEGEELVVMEEDWTP